MNARATSFIARAGLLGAALLLGGCAQLGAQFGGTASERETARPHPRAEDVARRSERSRPVPRSERKERQERPAPERDEAALREGIALYHEGEFDAAIRRLNVVDLNSGPVRRRVSALKYMAFSYCVTERPAPCRQAFERALRLDPAFELAAGEEGHPQWGPVFAKAQQSAGREGTREASR